MTIEAASAITNSKWTNRIWYSWLVTAALLVGLLVCAFLDRPSHIVSTLAWAVVFNNVLMLVAPSAEQIVKMLAQVAAIRSGKGS